MATTTNYAWETPDDTDLVKDGAAAIRTLGSSIDTTTKALNPSTTLGDIEYRSSTANTNTRLGIGSTGQVLTVAGGVPTWAASAGGGKVLQVVYGSTTTSVSSASTTYADTNLTATITPTLATSKVLVLVAQNGANKDNGSSSNSIYLRILRDATNIGDTSVVGFQGAAATLYPGSITINVLDTPATTSAITYKTQFKNEVASGNIRLQYNADLSSMMLLEIGA